MAPRFSFGFWVVMCVTCSVLPSVRGSDATCTQHKNVIIGKNFIKKSNAASADACCSACFAYGYACKAFTYQISTKYCFLKDNTEGNDASSDHISGSPGSGPRPEPNTTVKTRACQPPHHTYPFCNASLSLDARVDDLIGRLHEDEIPPLLTAREGGGGSPGPPGNISRLGLPEYDWGVNCIHGVQTTCGRDDQGEIMCPTSFPNPNALGSSWNASMWREIGSIIGVELRSLWLQGATEASHWSGQPHAGLDCWSPNINIARDPRWGRNQEVPGEDPFANGVFGAQYTKGLQQGQDDRFVQVVVTLKHWDAYSLEDSAGFTRHNFDAKLSNFTLADTYFPAFKAAVVEGGALGVMCSYNSINGVPTCANGFLDHVLRQEWNFTGYITSDSGAVADIYRQHHYAKDGKGATCAALKDGGCDIDSGAVYASHLLEAVHDSSESCDMEDVKVALRRTLGLRFRLGLFDPIEDQPYWHVNRNVVNSSAHQATNKLSTRESMVLLQNHPSLGLPFTKGKTVAVIGPHANASSALVGNYLGQICPKGLNDHSCVETPFEAIARLNEGGSVVSAPGSEITKSITNGVEEAVKVAQSADYVVLALGIDESVEGESHDRTSVDLPDPQHQLAKAVLATGKPAVVVLINGGMVAVEEEKALAPAVLEAFYPGFWGAEAIAQTIFGDNDNLGGKLAITVYPKDYIKEVSMTDMRMEPHDGGPGRSYRYYTGNATYPAFTGMSLTTFAVQAADEQSVDGPHWVVPVSDLGSTFTHDVKVTNTGTRTGDEVVFMFIKGQSAANPSLIRRLAGFQRVHLRPGQSVVVPFTITLTTLQSTSRSNGDIIVTPGDYEVHFSTGGEVPASVVHVRVTGEGRTVLARFPQFEG